MSSRLPSRPSMPTNRRMPVPRGRPSQSPSAMIGIGAPPPTPLSSPPTSRSRHVLLQKDVVIDIPRGTSPSREIELSSPPSSRTSRRQVEEEIDLAESDLLKILLEKPKIVATTQDGYTLLQSKGRSYRVFTKMLEKHSARLHEKGGDYLILKGDERDASPSTPSCRLLDKEGLLRLFQQKERLMEYDSDSEGYILLESEGLKYRILTKILRENSKSVTQNGSTYLVSLEEDFNIKAFDSFMKEGIDSREFRSLIQKGVDQTLVDPEIVQKLNQQDTFQSLYQSFTDLNKALGKDFAIGETSDFSARLKEYQTCIDMYKKAVHAYHRSKKNLGDLARQPTQLHSLVEKCHMSFWKKMCGAFEKEGSQPYSGYSLSSEKEKYLEFAYMYEGAMATYELSKEDLGGLLKLPTDHNRIVEKCRDFFWGKMSLTFEVETSHTNLYLGFSSIYDTLNRLKAWRGELKVIFPTSHPVFLSRVEKCYDALWGEMYQEIEEEERRIDACTKFASTDKKLKELKAWRQKLKAILPDKHRNLLLKMDLLLRKVKVKKEQQSAEMKQDIRRRQKRHLTACLCTLIASGFFGFTGMLAVYNGPPEGEEDQRKGYLGASLTSLALFIIFFGSHLCCTSKCRD